MLSNEYDVGTPAGQRELVLEEHFNVEQPGGDQVGPQSRDTALPRTTLTRTWALPGANCHLVSDELSEVVLDGRKATNRLTKERHKSEPQAARSVSCGWGHFLRRKPVGPQLRW